MREGCNESWHNDVAMIQAKDRCCLGMIKADQHDEIVHYLHDDSDNIIDDELAISQSYILFSLATKILNHNNLSVWKLVTFQVHISQVV